MRFSYNATIAVIVIAICAGAVGIAKYVNSRPDPSVECHKAGGTWVIQNDGNFGPVHEYCK